MMSLHSYILTTTVQLRCCCADTGIQHLELHFAQQFSCGVLDMSG